MFKKIIIIGATLAMVATMGITAFADEVNSDVDTVSGATTVNEPNVRLENDNGMNKDEEESKGLLNEVNDKDEGYFKVDPRTGVTYADYNDYWNEHPDEIVDFLSTIEEEEWEQRTENNGIATIQRGWLLNHDDYRLRFVFATKTDAINFAGARSETYGDTALIQCINNCRIDVGSSQYNNLYEKYLQVPIIVDPVIYEEPEEEPVIDEPVIDEPTVVTIHAVGHVSPAITCAKTFDGIIKTECADIDNGTVKVICGTTVSYANFKDGKLINRYRVTKAPKNIVKTIEVGKVM